MDANANNARKRLYYRIAKMVQQVESGALGRGLVQIVDRGQQFYLPGGGTKAGRKSASFVSRERVIPQSVRKCALNRRLSVIPEIPGITLRTGTGFQNLYCEVVLIIFQKMQRKFLACETRIGA